MLRDPKKILAEASPKIETLGDPRTRTRPSKTLAFSRATCTVVRRRMRMRGRSRAVWVPTRQQKLQQAVDLDGLRMDHTLPGSPPMVGFTSHRGFNSRIPVRPALRLRSTTELAGSSISAKPITRAGTRRIQRPRWTRSPCAVCIHADQTNGGGRATARREGPKAGDQSFARSPQAQLGRTCAGRSVRSTQRLKEN
jgi:hypothetical protein